MVRRLVFLRDLVRNVRRDDVPGASAELAFRFLFALFPFVIFLATLSGFVMNWLGVPEPTGRVITAVGDLLPGEAVHLLEEPLRDVLETTRGGLLSVSALVALWAASTGTRTLMKMMDRAYGVEGERPFLFTYALSLALTILAAGVFVGGFVLLVTGRAIADALGLAGTWVRITDVARIPAVYGALLAAVTFIYWVAPNVSVRVRQVLPGALVAVTLWVLATLGFAFYVAHFGAYNETYGALGGAVLLLLWFYITAFVMLLGAEINGLTARAAADEASSSQAAESVAAPGS